MTPLPFTLSADDMLAGNRLAIRRYIRKGLPKFSLFVLVVAVTVTLFVSIESPQPIATAAEVFAKILALYIGVAAVLVAYLLYVAPRQRAKKNMSQMPALSRAQTVTWDETAITFTSDSSHAAIPFADLHQWAADDAMVLLYPADHVFYLVPRRIVTDNADWNRLLAAITQAGIKQI